MNKGVVLYPENSLQTMHFLVGGGGGNNGDCTGNCTTVWSDVSAFLGEAYFFSFHFLVKPLKSMNSTVEEMPITDVVLMERGVGWVGGPYIRPLVGPPIGPRSDPLFM